MWAQVGGPALPGCVEGGPASEEALEWGSQPCSVQVGEPVPSEVGGSVAHVTVVRQQAWLQTLGLA